MKIGQALGVKLKFYLTLIMSYISSFHEEKGVNNDCNGWKTVIVDGKTMGIKICTLEKKCQAFETLLIYYLTLGGKYVSYLLQMLIICILCLKYFMKMFGRPVLGKVYIIIHNVTNFIQLLSPQPVDLFSQTKLRWKALNEDYPHICGMHKSDNKWLRYQAISSCKSFIY